MDVLPELKIQDQKAKEEEEDLELDLDSDDYVDGFLSSLTLADSCNNDPFLNLDFCAFKILGLLGRGSYSDVWKAQCKDYTVALKIINSHNEVLRGAFYQEVEAMRNLDHPNIIEILGACVHPVYAIVTEYMSHGSLDQLLHESKHVKYEAGHVFLWASQCADAMAYIHKRGMVHSDLKPANLLLAENCKVLKIADFGTMIYMSTDTKYRQGSAPWMAPEVFAGAEPSKKSDYYSFGIILWEMITRMRPYSECKSADEILWSVYGGLRPPLIEGIPTKLMELIESCWDKSPGKRPSSKQIRKVLTILRMMYPNPQELIISKTESEQKKETTDDDNAISSAECQAEKKAVATGNEESPPLSLKEMQALNEKHSLIEQFLTTAKCLDLFLQKNFIRRMMRQGSIRRSSLDSNNGCNKTFTSSDDEFTESC